MLSVLVFFSFALLITVALFQSVYVILYARQFSTRQKSESHSYQPKVAVVLCLRGADPGLTECLEAVHRQNYPDYEVHLVLDCECDPAHQVFKEFNAANGAEIHIHQFVHVFETVSSHGSLKCQAIVYAIKQLGPEIEIVALLDADAIVDACWLSKLVTPLAEEQIGASTGNRWFSPMDERVGSWVRQIWNAAAIVQMQLYQIAWGGSLAIRMDVIEKTGLLNRWSTALCEDTMISSVLADHKLRVHRVADLVVDNHETISLSSCMNWIMRQLLTVRLYHKLWPLVFAHAVGVGLAILVPLTVAIVSALTGRWNWAIFLTATWLSYQLCNILLVRKITMINLHVTSATEHARSDGLETTRRRANPFSYWCSLILVQLVQPWAAIKAALATSTEWRGIRYSIKNRTVELNQYAAYQNRSNNVSESIR